MRLTSIVMVFFCVFVAFCNAIENKTDVTTPKDARAFVGKMLEQGRTLVHNTFKRFMILLPVIFFKLGIAFTMLVLVTMVSVNNGFIGFLLLVVGLSSVLARLQEARKPPVVPYVNPLPLYQAKYIQDWDRKDRGIREKETTQVYGHSYGQQYIYPQMSGYFRQNGITA
ncbi:uncharacterized protein [Diabrotica undecimpunctata]|uniref:uncharacterized protein n=1 Tax=Diabrotica undecimpunctata TaxID=50387 RepID=UPI003B632434